MEKALTPEDIEAAIKWFSSRKTTMPGARRMYAIALTALQAIRVDNQRLEGLNRRELIEVIHYLRTACINRGKLIDRLEAKNE